MLGAWNCPTAAVLCRCDHLPGLQDAIFLDTEVSTWYYILDKFNTFTNLPLCFLVNRRQLFASESLLKFIVYLIASKMKCHQHQVGGLKYAQQQ